MDIDHIYMMHEAAGGSTELRNGSEHAAWAELFEAYCICKATAASCSNTPI
jgi:hypothetical protein